MMSTIFQASSSWSWNRDGGLGPVVTADWNSSLRQLFSVDSGAAGERSVNAIAPSAASTTLARSSLHTSGPHRRWRPSCPRCSTQRRPGFFDTVSRLLSTRLPNPAGELLSGALLLVRRISFPHVSPTALAAHLGAPYSGGSGPGVPLAAACAEISAWLPPRLRLRWWGSSANPQSAGDLDHPWR